MNAEGLYSHVASSIALERFKDRGGLALGIALDAVLLLSL
jgi:hypothetical protein